MLSCCATLAVGCDSSQKGVCQGTHLGQSVNWPIDEEMTSFDRTNPDRYGNKKTFFRLRYVTDSLKSKGIHAMGVDIAFNGDPRIDSPVSYDWVPDEQTDRGPDANFNGGDYWTPYAVSANDNWTQKYIEPGPPKSATLTLEHIDTAEAQGHFVYRYADGSELACSFDLSYI